MTDSPDENSHILMETKSASKNSDTSTLKTEGTSAIMFDLEVKFYCSQILFKEANDAPKFFSISIESTSTIQNVKEKLYASFPQEIPIEMDAIRMILKGRLLKNEELLEKLFTGQVKSVCFYFLFTFFSGRNKDANFVVQK